MKFSLRKLSLAGAFALMSSPAFAFGTITNTGTDFILSTAWENAEPATFGNSNARFSTAFGTDGEFYVLKNDTKQIFKYTSESTSGILHAPANVAAFSITSDDAGNLIWSNSEGGSTQGSYVFYILPKGKNAAADIITVTCTMPEGTVAGRVDQLSHVVGNVMGEDGGFIYVSPTPPSGSTMKKVVCHKIANGDFVTSYASTGDLPAASSSGTCTSSYFTDFATVAALENPANAAMVKTYNSGAIYLPNADMQSWKTYSHGAFKSSHGSTCFELGGERFFVYTVKDPSTLPDYSPSFYVVRERDNADVSKYFAGDAAAPANGALAAKISDDGYSATIYRYNMKTGYGIQVFTFTDNRPAVKFDNSNSNWENVYAYVWNGDDNNSWPGKKMTLGADGNYSVIFDDINFTPENIIFSNGDGEQTSTLSFVNHKTYSKPTGVETYNVRYNNNESNWENVYAYVWNGGNNNSWPGQLMTQGDENVWSAELTLSWEPENIIFNNGNGGTGNQTDDDTFENGKMYGPEFPVAPAALYLVGQFNGWTPADATYAMSKDNRTYTITMPELEGMFKVVADADWALSYGGAGDSANFESDNENGHVNMVSGTAENAWPGSSVNFNIPAKLVDVTVTFTFAPYGASSMKVEGTPYTAVESIAIDRENADVTIGSVINLAATVTPANATFATVTWSSSNTDVATVSNAGVVTPKAEGSAVITATAEGKSVECAINVVGQSSRAAFAYKLEGESKGVYQYEVRFKSSSDNANARLIMTNTEDATDVKTVEIGAVSKGSNAYTVDCEIDADAPSKEYTWTIELTSENVKGDQPAVIYKADAANQPSVVRGGVVTITDPEQASYGMTVVAHGKAQGFDVYDQEGVFVGKFQNGSSHLSSTNQSSVFRGAERAGKAVFADWSDGAAGYWVFDPMNPETEIYNILTGTKNSKGLYTYEGVQTSGGASCIAFYGKGENEMMYAFEEDLNDNKVTSWPIAGAEHLTVAPNWVSNRYSKAGLFLNTTVDIVPTENGLFISQCRDVNGSSKGVPTFVYALKGNDTEIYNAGQHTDLFKTCSSGIAVSPDGKLFALAGYNEFYVCNLSWDGDTPVFDLAYEMPINRTTFTHIKFDAANNIHIYDRDQKGYRVMAIPGEQTISTPANSEYIIKTQPTGVENIMINANDADAVYYNVNGVRVAADNLTPGVYVKVSGKKAQKVVVR